MRIGVHGSRLQRPEPRGIADALPVAFERLARAFAAVDREPIGKGRRIHRAEDQLI